MSRINPVEIVIAGVQKAATSSLHNYMGQMEGIITHDEREFTFFVEEDEYLKGYDKIYNEYFLESDDRRKVLIKNVGIIFWEDAMQRLKQHNPDVKIILIFRNPVARAYSAFWYAKLRGKEDANSFEEALQEAEGKSANKTNKGVDAYFERGNYAAQLKTLYNYFSPHQVKIILFEDFKENTNGILKELIQFCDLKVTDFSMINKKLKGASQARFTWLANFTNRQNSLKSNLRKLVPLKLRRRLRMKVNEINKKDFSVPPMNNETRQKLINYYKPMVNELSKLIGRDLSHWNK